MAKQLKDLNVGDKVKFGRYQVESESTQDVVWKVAAKNHAGYPANSVTLITEKIIDLRAFDAKEPNNSDNNRKSYGNNRYKDSNLRQWLNKSGQPWFEKSHSADEPPINANLHTSGQTEYRGKNGFMGYFNEMELSGLLDTTLTVAKNTVTDGGGTETVTDKFFLASNTEVGLANEPGGAEGSRLALFGNDASRISYLTQQAFSNTKATSKPGSVGAAWHYWLRSPHSSNSSHARIVHSSGALSSGAAFDGNSGVRPLCNLKSDILVSDSPDVDGAYILTFAPPHKILFQENDDIQVFTSGEWETVGQSGDDLIELFETHGMDSLASVNVADLETRQILVNKENDAPKIKVKAIPHPQLVFPTGDITLKMLDKIHHFKIFANKANDGLVKIIFSVDEGETWQTYDVINREFAEIDHTDLVAVKQDGVAPDDFNTVGQAWNEVVEGKIRFAYYIEQQAISDIAAVDKLEIKMDLRGRWQKAKHATDYDYEYDNEHIYVSFATSGSYKVNYQG